jgi:lysophospholipase L1-like esterase
VVQFCRYVAIGDSQTEGLWDGDDSAGLIGFADRLAEIIDSHCPGLHYANLAVRGRRIRDVLDDQLPTALGMKPDLVTVCVGMNDVTRPGRNFDTALRLLDDIYDTLAGTGATVATTTFPDVTRILPVGRLIAGRVHRINDTIRGAAERHGFALVDLYAAPSMTELDTWSDDRVHGSTLGHIRFTEAAVEALGLPGGNHGWAHPSGPPQRATLREQAYAQLQWTRHMLLPWAWRHLQGRSTGDGREPKRPQLAPVRPAARSR